MVKKRFMCDGRRSGQLQNTDKISIECIRNDMCIEGVTTKSIADSGNWKRERSCSSLA